MKKSILNFKNAALAFAMLLVGFGCSEKMDRYEDPEWLGGTNIETLEKAGKYTIFLQLMEKADYRNTVEKQTSTLFVPDDDAFRTYFEKKGISSIDDMSEDQAFELFTLHFLANSVNANHLVYEKMWNRLESATAEYRSLFFRKQTISYSIPYIEIPRYDPTYQGQELFIYTDLKYIPLFSKFYFQDYNGNGEIDYPMMYPDSKWSGLMNWHNAVILPPPGKENTTEIEDLAVPTGSGFLYYLDRVVEPMPNIDQYLAANQDKYGLFYDLMQRYATYAQSSVADKQGRKLYTKGYSDISNIAAEKGPNNASNQVPAWALDIYTVFLPDNDLLQSYFDNTVLKTYASLDEVPDITMRYILQSQMTNRLELKSKFTQKFYNIYGDLSVIDAADVEPGFMCSNGVIYKSKRILEPNVFLCVPGKLFFDSNYSTFLTMLTRAGMIATLSGDREVTLFAPTNEELNDANIRLVINDEGGEEFQQKADDEQWVFLPDIDLITYAQDHICYGKISDLSGEGYIEMLSHNYVHYSDNQLHAGLNDYKGNTAATVDYSDSKNGILYHIDQPIETEYRMGQYISNDPDLSDFTQLMIETGLLDPNFEEGDTKNKYPNIALTEAADAYYWTAFIPTNAAIAQAKLDGTFPDTTGGNIDALKSFVNYHFIQKTIVDDGTISGTFNTLLGGAELTIDNSPNNLRITDASGQQVSLNHANANHLVRRGVVHKIGSVLHYE